MKNRFLLLGVLLASSSVAQAQDSAQDSVASTVGIGIALNSPASTPFSWHVVGYYNLHHRLAVGYELQHMERLKQASTPYFTAEFAERLHHNSLLIWLGVLF